MPQDPVTAGFVDKQVGLIVADRDAVGKIEAIHQQRGLVAERIVFEYPSVTAVLQQVEQAGAVAAGPLFRGKFGAGIAEIDGSVFRNGKVVGISDGLAIELIHERYHASVLPDSLQPQVGVCHVQEATGKLDAQWPAAGIGEYLQIAAVCMKRNNLAARGAGIKQAAEADGDIFRAMVFIEFDCTGNFEAIVFRKRINEAAVGRRIPGDRCHRYRPQGQVQHQQQQDSQPDPEYLHRAYLRLPIICRNSERVRASFRNAPSIWLVTIVTLDL